MKVTSVEQTPNPNARKFLLDQIISQHPMSFFNAESAKGYELAERIWTIPGITSVFFLDNFVTVNKSPATPWADVVKEVRQILTGEKKQEK